jgi:aminoglycoside 3'-phosphotransferase-2
VTSGMSGASVFRVTDGCEPDQYLKIGTGTLADSLSVEIERTKWLSSVGIHVPKIAAHFADKGITAVMISSLGDQTAEQIRSDDWRTTLSLIASAFAKLHSLPVENCPFNHTLRVRLARARELVRSGDVDPADFDERNAGVAPEDLYCRLEATAPKYEDCVVTHGDAMFSNILIGRAGQIGFVDCSHSGRADRYVDLALLLEEAERRFGVEARRVFLDGYGVLEWDLAKDLFYRDLYELFG